MSLRALMVLVLIFGCVLGWIVHHVRIKVRIKASEAAYQQAKLTREVAEIALVEYVEGIFKRDVETVEGEISLAEADLKRADKANVPEAEIASKEQEVKRAKFHLHQAQRKSDDPGGN